MKNLAAGFLLLMPLSFLIISSLIFAGHSTYFNISLEIGRDPDTTIIENITVGVGSRIMTDQDALVILPPSDARLASIDLYYSAVQTLNSDSSRLYVKSLPSYSCGANGGSHPFQSDQYTLGITNNVAVGVGWNHYVFDEPIAIPSDSIFIWPDLIQQVNPRIVFATGSNNPDIMRMNGTLCGNAASNGTHSTDFVCSLTFVSTPPCPAYLVVMDADSICYAADTILARTTITASKDITYLSRDQVMLDTTFQIDQTAKLSIDMTGCPDD